MSRRDNETLPGDEERDLEALAQVIAADGRVQVLGHRMTDHGWYLVVGQLVAQFRSPDATAPTYAMQTWDIWSRDDWHRIRGILAAENPSNPV